MPAVANSRTPRLGRDPRGRVHASAGAGAPRTLGPGRLRRCGLTVHVRDAEPAPDDEFGPRERSEERTDHLGEPLERSGVEDLAADVCMDARQFDGRRRLERGNGVCRGPRGDGEAELRILLPRFARTRRVCLTPGVTAPDLRSVKASGCGIQQGTEASDFVEQSMTIWPTLCCRAVASSSTDLLLP